MLFKGPDEDCPTAEQFDQICRSLEVQDAPVKQSKGRRERRPLHGLRYYQKLAKDLAIQIDDIRYPGGSVSRAILSPEKEEFLQTLVADLRRVKAQIKRIKESQAKARMAGNCHI